MTRAIEISDASEDEPDRSSPAPRVGAVLALNDRIIGEAYRGQTGPGDHAEFALFRRLGDTNVAGSTLYTTLEPCSARQTHKPCARHVIERDVATVFIGLYDPNPTIYRAGWKLLDEAGIELRDFSPDLRDKIKASNARFLSGFELGRGDSGKATFDYTLNGRRFDIHTETAGEFRTRWSSRGASSIYLSNGDPQYRVAQPRHAREFHKIDDPGAYDFGSHAVPLEEGDIGIVRNETGFLLVRVTDVLNADRGDPRWEVSIEWEARQDRDVPRPRSRDIGQR